MQYIHVIKETNFKYRFSPSIGLILNVNKRLPFDKFLFLIIGLHACIHYVIRNILMLEIISHCSFACLEQKFITIKICTSILKNYFDVEIS